MKCLADREHWVYRCYDADGQLLYIGCTSNVAARFNGHRSADSPASRTLMQRMTRYSAEVYPDRAAGLAAEREAIIAEKPLLNAHFNRQHDTWLGGPVVAMIRKHHGVGPGDMAGRVGISTDHLLRIEAGEKPVSADLMNRICHALGHLPLDEVPA
jgi:predicted GIY-YIG superfamily endonuclease/DNA-binding XRE family transcriptional regulator